MYVIVKYCFTIVFFHNEWLAEYFMKKLLTAFADRGKKKKWSSDILLFVLLFMIMLQWHILCHFTTTLFHLHTTADATSWAFLYTKRWSDISHSSLLPWHCPDLDLFFLQVILVTVWILICSTFHPLPQIFTCDVQEESFIMICSKG